MTELTFTFCDYCNPMQLRDSNNPFGYAEWDKKTCIKEFGWKDTPNGIMCLNCQEEMEGSNG